MSELIWRHAPSLVEDALQNLLPEPKPDQESGLARLRCAMRHGVFGGGKRLRSQLVLESACVVGGPEFNPERAISAACALELIHAYSLVHDDLPSMDDADTRRGQPACHKQYGEATAILAGDALLTLAFDILARDALSHSRDANYTVQNLRVIQLIGEAAGERGMVGGQNIDIDWTKSKSAISGEQLQQMHALKTGALIRASAEAGAILGGGSEFQISLLHVYGENLGRAFQLHDDVLDVEGDPNITGKASSDAANDKMSAPAVLGLKKTKELAAKAAEQAIEALQSFGKEAETLRQLARFVVQREK